MKPKPYTFNVIIERDADGFLVGTVPELRGCHSQAKSMDVLLRRMREAVELCLEVEDEVRESPEFIGVQRITI